MDFSTEPLYDFSYYDNLDSPMSPISSPVISSMCCPVEPLVRLSSPDLNTIERASPKRASKPAAPKHTSKPAAPKHTSKPAAPKHTSKPAAPKHTSKRASKKASLKPAAPKHIDNNLVKIDTQAMHIKTKGEYKLSGFFMPEFDETNYKLIGNCFHICSNVCKFPCTHECDNENKKEEMENQKIEIEKKIKQQTKKIKQQTKKIEQQTKKINSRTINNRTTGKIKVQMKKVEKQKIEIEKQRVEIEKQRVEIEKRKENTSKKRKRQHGKSCEPWEQKCYKKIRVHVKSGYVSAESILRYPYQTKWKDHVLKLITNPTMSQQGINYVEQIAIDLNVSSEFLIICDKLNNKWIHPKIAVNISNLYNAYFYGNLSHIFLQNTMFHKSALYINTLDQCYKSHQSDHIKNIIIDRLKQILIEPKILISGQLLSKFCAIEVADTDNWTAPSARLSYHCKIPNKMLYIYGSQKELDSGVLQTIKAQTDESVHVIFVTINILAKK